MAVYLFSETIIKRLLYERYSYETSGGSLTSSKQVGVTPINIHTLPSYTNTVTVVAGRGAQRKYDGAPVNATIYPFIAHYVVCKQIGGETIQTTY